MSTVQIYQLPLSKSVEKSSDWSDILDSLQSTKGVRSVSWALQEEDSKFASIIANFKSLDAQKEWTASSCHEVVKGLLKYFSSGDIYDDVVVLAEDAEPALGAKTVELVSWIYFKKNVDEDFKKKCAHGFKKFEESIAPSKWASGGMVAGWSINTFRHNDKEAQRFTGLIGWQSVEAHYECKKTPTFTDYIHWLENGDEGVEMVHYKFSEHKSSATGIL